MNGRLTPEYQAWSQMKNRCTNPSAPKYKNYGGRGITICERWLESFDNFLADMGPRPSPVHSLDRRKNHLGYAPGNCRWATSTEQNRNTRRTRNVQVNGATMLLIEALDVYGVSRRTFYERVKGGMSDAEALLTPSLQGRVKNGRVHLP
jgi:hypothetical protein